MYRFRSLTGRLHTAAGAVHIAVRRALPVRAGHRVPRDHRDLRAVARTRFRPFRLRAVEGPAAGRHRRARPGAGHVHQLGGHHQLVLNRAPSPTILPREACATYTHRRY